VGQALVSDTLSIAFLTLAGGSVAARDRRRPGFGLAAVGEPT
jgi:hypothetical protein